MPSYKERRSQMEDIGVIDVTPRPDRGTDDIIIDQEMPREDMPVVSPYANQRPGWNTQAQLVSANMPVDNQSLMPEQVTNEFVNDPAKADREILGSKTLGDVATGADAFATELSKLDNGALLSLATLGGFEHSDFGKLLKNNVDITTKFQEHLERANPKAAQIGKWAAIVDGALLTTPIWGTTMGKALVTGYAGAASSALSDMGSNAEAPERKDLLKELGGHSALAGILGAKVGNLINLKHLPLTSRHAEAGVEGVSPEEVEDKAHDFKSYIKNRFGFGE